MTEEAGGPLACPRCALAHPIDERFCRNCGMPLVYAGTREEEPITEAHERARKVRPQYAHGDLIRVTLFESSAGGLFFQLEGGARSGNFLVIPDQNVDGKGDISIPYAGQIRARGRTPVQVQEAIVNALKNRALEPQAVVTVVQQHDALISVVGEVGSAIRFPPSATGEPSKMAEAIMIKVFSGVRWYFMELSSRSRVAALLSSPGCSRSG